MNYRLTLELREQLKKPLGQLLAKPDWQGQFITVGDQCSYLAAKAGKQPMLAVYDNLIQRKETADEKACAIESLPGKTLAVKNPAGTITAEAVEAIRLGIESPPAKVRVDGEEDLLVLPCIVHAPEGTAVYYGQPNVGIVKIMVTKESKKKARETLSSM